MASISVSLPDDLLDEVESAVDEETKYANRSHLVQVAVGDLLEKEGRLGSSEFDAAQ